LSEVLTIWPAAVNHHGNVAGDIAIEGWQMDDFSSSPYGYLEASYTSLKRLNGQCSTLRWPGGTTPVCAANLSADLEHRPVQDRCRREDRVKTRMICPQ
jgi:hypothetical protein